jgi:predicted  nucleic acid-binding Zn-ribbon protein
MAHRREHEGQLTTWVCITCGGEIYSRGPAAGRLACPRCGGSVFRPFDTPSPSDHVAEDYLEDVARRFEAKDKNAAYRDPSMHERDRP